MDEYTTSKDSLHLLKLSGVLHVLTSALDCLLQEKPVIIPETVSKETLKSAQNLYHCLSQMHYIFTNAVTSLHNVILTPVKSVELLEKRIIKAVERSKGPCTSLRALNHSLKGLNSETLRMELLNLERCSFGKLHEGSRKKTYFMKPHPDTLSENDSVIKRNSINLDQYSINFNDDSKLTQSDKDMCANHHPHYELIMNSFANEATDSDESLF